MKLYLGLFVFILGSWAMATVNDDLKLLVQESKKSEAVITEAKDKVRSAKTIQREDKTLIYADKQTTQEMIKTLRNYPHTPVSTRKFWSHMAQELPPGVDKRQIYKDLSDISSPSPVNYLGLSRTVISSMETYKFTDSEQREVRNSILDYVREQSSEQGTLLELLVYGVVVKNLVKAKWIEPKPETLEELESITTDGHDLNVKLMKKYNEIFTTPPEKDDFSKIPTEKLDEAFKTFTIPEFSGMNKLRTRLVKLVDQIKRT